MGNENHGSLFDDDSKYNFETDISVGTNHSYEIGLGFQKNNLSDYCDKVGYYGGKLSVLPNAGEKTEGSNRHVGYTGKIYGGLGTDVFTEDCYLYGEAGLTGRIDYSFKTETQKWNPDWGNSVIGYAVTPNGPRYVEVFPDRSRKITNEKTSCSAIGNVTLGGGYKNEETGWVLGGSVTAKTDLSSPKNWGTEYTVEASKKLFNIDGVQGRVGGNVSYNAKNIGPYNKGFYGGISFSLGF